MAKKIISLLLALSLSLALCACGGGDETAAADMEKLSETMLAADSTLPEMKISGSWEENAEKTFSYISDMEYNKVRGFFLAYAADGMAYEIAVLQLDSSADAETAADSLGEHVQTRVQMYKTYEPAQVDRASNAVVKVDGSFALLIMCDNQSTVETAFKEFVS